MRNLLIAIFFVIRTVSFADEINAKTFGAKGDGIQEDAPYLNAALTKALSLGQDLYIPAGTYKCDQFSNEYSKILRMDQSGIKKIRIHGQTGTKITTSRPQGTLFYIFDKNVNVNIENIFFENTHDISTSQTTAIQLLGTSLTAIKNFTIQNCTFEGFTTAIVAQGVEGFLVQNNIFSSPKGHDNAQNNSQPAVYIWLFDNANGQCFDVKILNNSANGYTGKNITSTVTKRPMDGFVYGVAYGIRIQGNTTNNFSEEHIALQPKTTYANWKDSAVITGNKFYQAIPAGSMKNGITLDANYGVRADCNNVKITSNDFYDYTLGILMLPFQYVNLGQYNTTITGNRFYSPNSKTYHVREAIKIQGTLLLPSTGVVITGNVISINGIQMKSNRSVISLYDCKNVTLENNIITGQNIDLNGYSLGGILTQDCLNLINMGNQITFK